MRSRVEVSSEEKLGGGEFLLQAADVTDDGFGAFHGRFEQRRRHPQRMPRTAP